MDINPSVNVQINQLMLQLAQHPQSSEDIFVEYRDLWRELGFSQAQVALWLASLPHSNQVASAQVSELKADYQTTPDLTEHLLSLLKANGGRLPMTQILKKLPAGVTATGQRIQKLVVQSHQMQIKGPLVILVD